MKIKVTRTDIEKGKRYSYDSCPIALAVHRTKGGHVFIARCICAGGKQYVSPPEVLRFIDDFDEGKPVKPFEFTL